MKVILKTSLAAAAIAASTMAVSQPARAAFDISFGTHGFGFTLSSGGYCDRWGCPDEFWDLPVYYCPIYYRGG